MPGRSINSTSLPVVRLSILSAPIGAVISIGVIYLAALVDLPRRIPAGGISLLALSTVLAAAAALFVWFLRTRVDSRIVWETAPLVLLLMWVFFRVPFSRVSPDVVQNLVVFVSFVGFLCVSAYAARRHSWYPQAVLRALKRAGVLVAIVYITSVLVFGFGSKDWIGSPGVGLVSLLFMSAYAAGWRWRDPGSLGGLLLMFFVLVVALTRTPLAVALLMVTSATLWRRGRVRLPRLAAYYALVLVIGAGTIWLVEPLRVKLMQGDNAVEVGGVKLNTSGRAVMWATVYASALDRPIVGKGLGSSRDALMELTKTNHPHNDYLRLWHELGLVGLALWVFAFGRIYSLLRRKAGADSITRTQRRIITAAKYSVVAIALGMITDNAIVYGFIMMPLGVVVGAALGTVKDR